MFYLLLGILAIFQCLTQFSTANQTYLNAHTDFMREDATGLSKQDIDLTNDLSNTIDLHQTLVDLYKNVKFVREIFLYLGSVITVLGCILNSLCIIVFYKSKIFRNSSFPFYVYVISIVDTLNIFLRFAVPQLIEKVIRTILVDKYNVNPYEVNQEKYDRYTSYITSDYHCSLFIYVYNSFTLVSVWLMVAVSLERLLIIKFTLQTKYMIKLRAFLILFFIFIAIFSLNIFDLAPGLYIKPQWYANLTLLCERDDTMGTDSNSTRIYKRLGPLSFNTETFAFTRTILQSIVPFLVVLIFNSMIIYNFKQIKLAARGRGKSNSCVSVNSFSGNGLTTSQKIRQKSQMRRHQINLIQKQNGSQLQIPGKRSAIEFTLGSSRSPSPFQNLSAPNTPVTPTSIVSALNLVPNDSQALQKNNSFLMPPEHMNGSATPSLITANSSANLSVATTTNLTTTTCVNQQQGSSSDKLSFMITSVLPNKKNVTTTTTTSGSRVSFKRRVNKIRINRETDIMLIVLSFSILLSQLPCTIAWYLIYYRNILKYIDITSFFFNARTPILLYIIRLLEMCYFSLNFFFYITLSPSLRKELRKKLPVKLRYLTNSFFKCFCSNLSKKSQEKNEENAENQKNSSGDYTNYIGKMRSISPLRRPNFLMKSPYENSPSQNVKQKPVKTSKKSVLTNLFKKKPVDDSLEIEIDQAKANNLINSSNKIKIIIDNLYDEEEEPKVDEEILNDKNPTNTLLTSNKRMFNLSSPSFLNSLDNNNNNQKPPETVSTQTQTICVGKEKSNKFTYL